MGTHGARRQDGADQGWGGIMAWTTDETGVSPASAAVTSRPATECTTEDLLAEIMRRALKSAAGERNPHF